VLKQNSSKGQDDHRGPMAEIDFWASRTANLLFIKEQLVNEKITAIGDILAKSNSSYLSVFKIMCEDVDNGNTPPQILIHST
jgi:hypothetical protein